MSFRSLSNSAITVLFLTPEGPDSTISVPRFFFASHMFLVLSLSLSQTVSLLFKSGGEGFWRQGRQNNMAAVHNQHTLGLAPKTGINQISPFPGLLGQSLNRR